MQTIGGYSIVRRLGSGSRAHVHLGRSDIDGAAPTVALKVFHEATDTVSIGTEVEALSRTTSPHLLRIDDITLDDHGRPALILPRLSGTSLAALLVDRGGLHRGEAVTVLAPLAAAVGEMHRAGVAHRGIRCSRVLFDESGAPVLIGFGSALVPSIEPEGSSQATRFTPELRAAIAGDLVDLSALGRTVLEATEPAESTRSLIRWCSIAAAPADGTASAEFASELHDRLFDWARAAPIDFSARARVVPPIPARVETGDSAERGRRALRTSSREQERAPSAWSTMFLPEWITAMLAEQRRVTRSTRLPGALEVARRFLAPVRAPVWWMAGVVGVLLVAALVLVPSPRGQDADAREPRAGDPGSAARRAGPAPIPHPPLLPAPPDGEREAATIPPGSAAFETAVLGEDEIAAATALLTTRNGCLRDRSTTCLDRVDQQDSAALDNDRRLLTRMRDSEVDTDLLVDLTTSPVLIERLGASALLDLSIAPTEVDASAADVTPRSVLIVKGADGWRIRDLIIGGSVP